MGSSVAGGGGVTSSAKTIWTLNKLMLKIKMIEKIQFKIRCLRDMVEPPLPFIAVKWRQDEALHYLLHFAHC